MRLERDIFRIGSERQLDNQIVEYFNTTDLCRRIQNESNYMGTRRADASVKIEKWEAVFILLVTGIFAAITASFFNKVRTKVYLDRQYLDTTFDAGGNMNAGLTASNIVSHWTWTSTLLQSTTITAKYGVIVSFLYAAGCSIQLLIFSMVAVELRIRAPGAKTFLQVIEARFGRGPHLTFCAFALMSNLATTWIQMSGGVAVITTLVEDVSVEYAVTLITAVIGSYTLIGGLGAAIYVSYFHTATIYVIMLILTYNVYWEETDRFNSVGSISKVYNYVSCIKGPDGNTNNSYMAMVSENAMMFTISSVIGSFGNLFLDQSYWQSSVAAKPKQGAIGYLLAGVSWFIIPFSISSAMGLAYIALASELGAGLLSSDEIDEGMILPTIVSMLMGKTGSILFLVMVVMVITSTGAADVMAVTSILIYDFYGTYWMPYRRKCDANSCTLCGKGRGRRAKIWDRCVCISFNFCLQCHIDTLIRQEHRRRAVKPVFKCPIHGHYRMYTKYLSERNTWTQLWVILSFIPATLIFTAFSGNLDFVYKLMGVTFGAAVIPTSLCMVWDKLTGKAVVTGLIGGTFLAVITWLVVASTGKGGLHHFKANAGSETAMGIGGLVALLSGGLLTIFITLADNRLKVDLPQHEDVWENTRDIDNPLSPWTDKYTEELHLPDVRFLDNRPTLKDTELAFRNLKILVKVLSISLAAAMIAGGPLILMITIDVFSLQQFTDWIHYSEIWAILTTILMIVLPITSEGWEIYRGLQKRNHRKPKYLSPHDFR